MVICFECDTKTKAILDNFLTSDQYRDYSEVISTAIANLAVLRSRVPKSGSVVISSTEVSTAKNDRPSSVSVDKRSGSSFPALAPLASVHNQRHGASASAIPAVFRLDDITDNPPAIGKITTERWEKEGKIRLDRWIFGQYNKLLPAKVTCRALAHLLADKPHGVPLARAATVISEEAAVLGNYLSVRDSNHSLRREEALHTGFPHITLSAGGERVTNSGQLRYANHFVAGEIRKNEVSSLPIALKLIHCEGPEQLIQLTEPGARFALLRNPVLDGPQLQPTQKLSREEIDLLLDHISRHVPVELFAYQTLLAAILNGANTPDKLTASLQEMDIWWRDRKPEDTVSFFSTQRSGAISRMVDLELTQRERQGTRVTYKVTPPGEKFLRRTKPKHRTR